MTLSASASGRIREALRRSPEGCHLIPYFMAGFPSRDATASLLLAAQAAGAAVVELGLPYSDPLADGPTVQAAGQRALAQGMTVALALKQVRAARSSGLQIPLVVMTYLNPPLQMGLARFCEEAVDAGVDGVLVPDLPLEEAGQLSRAASAAGLSLSTMVAPTTPDVRLARLAELSTGFLYCVSRTGVTGGDEALTEGARQLLRRARGLTEIPLALGFGVRHRSQVEALSGLADAVAVGSALLQAIGDQEQDPARVAGEAIRELLGGVSGCPPTIRRRALRPPPAPPR